MDDRESVGSDSLVPSGTPYFQAILMAYLDDQAPSLGEVLFFAPCVFRFNEKIYQNIFNLRF